MALTGLEIYKSLPKTNCKQCGLPTCLAFAMKVAAGQAGLDQCPPLDPKARAALEEASAPPQQLVKIGAGERAIELGQETSLYRHEGKFQHPTAIAICVNDSLASTAIEERGRQIASLKFERLGATLKVDMAAVFNVSGQPRGFVEAARAASRASRKALALVSANVESLRAAGEALREERPLLWLMDAAAAGAKAFDMAKELGLPICLQAPGFDALVASSEAARAAGLKEFMLAPGPMKAKAALEFLSQSRRAAIVKKFRPMGYPIAMLATGGDSAQTLVEACWYVLKYAALVVVDTTRPEEILGILTSRQDIYTDPQKPALVDSTLHTVGNPGTDAPVLVTTNFALSYYSVESEVEASRVPSFILPVDTEGQSVLTAWAADKFNGKIIAKALKESGVESRVGHRKVVIPGYVAVISASLNEESGWEVLVGPKEASGLVPYLKSQWKP
ncbi:MAG: acetyl-CoA decarbonylase/synthase complex subunit gamma [Candidatus Sumerlaeota bacterium]|nr:acetyl-CoA decarbonylase/synthase complex subunit gamma [Candidatus Sumerlaeota bacterium]